MKRSLEGGGHRELLKPSTDWDIQVFTSVLNSMAEFEEEAAQQRADAPQEATGGGVSGAAKEAQLMRRISKHEFAGSK